MKRFLITVILLALLGGFSTAYGTEYKLYYLGGQSNMTGYGLVSELAANLLELVPGLWIYQSSAKMDNRPTNGAGIWALLLPGHGRGFKSDGITNTYSDRFGVELTLARRLRELDPTYPIALVKYAKGATSIHIDAGKFGCWDPDFNKGNGINQYDHFLATLRKALAVSDIDGDGTNDTLIPAGIVWMQGESDANDKEIASQYEANLKRLMNHIRSALGVDDLPVVIGRISDSGQDGDGKVWDYGQIVQQAQADFCGKDVNAALVNSTDKYSYSDRWHYDTAGFIDLGIQFAEAMHKLEQKQ